MATLLDAARSGRGRPWALAAILLLPPMLAGCLGENPSLGDGPDARARILGVRGNGTLWWVDLEVTNLRDDVPIHPSHVAFGPGDDAPVAYLDAGVAPGGTRTYEVWPPGAPPGTLDLERARLAYSYPVRGGRDARHGEIPVEGPAGP